MATFTATYVSSSSFTVSGDVTGYFPSNLRVRVDCGGWVLSSVASSVYSSPNTTVTLTQAVLTDPCGNAEVFTQHPDGVPIHTHLDDDTGGAGVTGTPPDHEWSGTQLRFKDPAGSWGSYVDLIGPEGAGASLLNQDNVSYTATSIIVANGDLFIAGQAIFLSDGTNIDYFIIDSISTNTLTVTPTETGSQHTDYDTGDGVYICGYGPWYKGAWALTTDYVLNSIVTNDGSAYLCMLAHTSDSTTEPGTGAYWASYWGLLTSKGDTGATGATGDAGEAGLTWEAAWVTATSYTSGDAVSNDGSSYICTADHTSDATDEPGTGSYWASYWDLLASKGDTGATGGMDWLGAWSLTTSYSENDTVTNDSSSYVCISGHTSSATDEPGTGTYWETYWILMSDGTPSLDDLSNVDFSGKSDNYIPYWDADTSTWFTKEETGGGSPTATVTAGEALSQYEVVYLDLNDGGKAKKAQADGSAAEAEAFGIVTESGGIADDATGEVTPIGEITNGAWSWTPGAKLYVSTTAGQLQETVPSSEDYVMEVATAITATIIYTNIKAGYRSTS